MILMEKLRIIFPETTVRVEYFLTDKGKVFCSLFINSEKPLSGLFFEEKELDTFIEALWQSRVVNKVKRTEYKIVGDLYVKDILKNKGELK